jgi:hypothetical protein
MATDYNAINFKNKDVDKFSTRFGNGDPISKRKQLREMREGVTPLKNSDGSISTHVLESGESGNKRKPYEVNPQVFPNDKGKTWTDLRGKGNEAYYEAKKRGEVIEFKSAKRAEKFAYGGPWKEGEAKKEAKAAYRKDKKEGNLYTQSEQFKTDKKRIKTEKRQDIKNTVSAVKGVVQSLKKTNSDFTDKKTLRNYKGAK